MSATSEVPALLLTDDEEAIIYKEIVSDSECDEEKEKEINAMLEEVDEDELALDPVVELALGSRQASPVPVHSAGAQQPLEMAQTQTVAGTPWLLAPVVPQVVPQFLQNQVQPQLFMQEARSVEGVPVNESKLNAAKPVTGVVVSSQQNPLPGLLSSFGGARTFPPFQVPGNLPQVKPLPSADPIISSPSLSSSAGCSSSASQSSHGSARMIPTAAQSVGVITSPPLQHSQPVVGLTLPAASAYNPFVVYNPRPNSAIGSSSTNTNSNRQFCPPVHSNNKPRGGKPQKPRRAPSALNVRAKEFVPQNYNAGPMPVEGKPIRMCY